MALPDSGNRKRQRYLCEDEISEFTPLSKRINNLHINNSFFPFVKQIPLQELKPILVMVNNYERYGRKKTYNVGRSGGFQINSSPYIRDIFSDLSPDHFLPLIYKDIHRAMMNGRLGDFDAGSSRNIDSSIEADPQAWGVECYNPDLTPAENPYYYESNRLLYELYMQRSQRSHLPAPNNHF